MDIIIINLWGKLLNFGEIPVKVDTDNVVSGYLVSSETLLNLHTFYKTGRKKEEKDSVHIRHYVTART